MKCNPGIMKLGPVGQATKMLQLRQGLRWFLNEDTQARAAMLSHSPHGEMEMRNDMSG